MSNVETRPLLYLLYVKCCDATPHDLTFLRIVIKVLLIFKKRYEEDGEVLISCLLRRKK